VSEKRTRWPTPSGWLAAVVALHLALLAYFAPPKLLFSKQPVQTVDYALHLYQVDRAREAFRGWHKLWSWDPQVLAGQPAGVVEDLTSKGTELFVIGLSALGVHPAFAFNLVIILVHLMLPFVAYGSARLFGLSRAASSVAALLWVLLWFFDSFLHWCWWIGMITWSAASQLTVLYVALLYRQLETRKRLLLVPIVLLSPLLALLHPFSALTLLVPCALLYARAFRSLGALEHGGLIASVLAAASTVLLWIGPLRAFRHYVGPTDVFMVPSLEYALLDTLDLLKDPIHTGDPVRTMLRTLCFAAAAVALVRWRRERDRRVLPLASFLLTAVALAYLSSYFALTRQTHPYRHIAPAMLAAALPCAALLTETLAPRKLRELDRSARLLLALCLVLIVPRFARNVVYYVPELLPERVVRSKRDLSTSPLVGLTESYPLVQRHGGVPESYAAVRNWLAQNHGGRGRVIVTEWVLAEYLATATTVPILGGIKERNVPHVDAHLFRSDAANALAGPKLDEFLERYAVGFAIVTGDFGILDSRRDILIPARAVAGHRIYRTRSEPSYFARGQGRIVRQDLNLVEVADTQGEDIIVRFHWMETLRCRPDCALERSAVRGDRVGFIRVQKPPLRFQIYNSYEL
jgi:hypothetical protein